MSVATEDSTVTYVGNNSTSTAYAITFPFQEDDHVKVSIKYSDGVVSLLSSSEYDVDGAASEVRTLAAWDNTHEVTLYRDLPITQPTEWPTSGVFPAAANETAADRLTMIGQQLDRKVGQAIRFEDPSTYSTTLPNTPNGIVGTDTDGSPIMLDQSAIREFALLAGGDSGSPVATFSNAALRAATVPSYLGQIGIQRDDGSQWKATALTAGAWVKLNTAVIVRSWAELTAALLIGGEIYVMGTITGTTLQTISVKGTSLYSLTDDSGNQGKLVRTHANGSSRTVLKISATDWRISGLIITTGHPLTTNRTDGDVGIELNDSAVVDISRGLIEHCEIYAVHTGIQRSNAANAKAAYGIKIRDNNIHSFVYGGIYIASNCKGTSIVDNRIFGKDPISSDTHDVDWNGIWLGNYGDYAQIHHNEIAYVGRHGIEYWNSQVDPINTDGNQSGKVAFNNIHNLLATWGGGSFGITAFGCGSVHVIGNTVESGSIGIECYNDPVNSGKIVCQLNTVNGIRGVGISVNGCTNADVSNNTIGSVVNAPGFEQMGIQVIYGAENVRINDNIFTDSGNKMLLVNAFRLNITGITNAVNGVVTVAEFLGDPFVTGKLIYFTGISGMTELNGTYKTMTFTGAHTFTIATDTSGFGAYTAGGVVQEKYKNISICGNTFTVSQIVNSAAQNYAIWMYDVQSVVCRNNEARVKTGVVAGFIRAANTSHVYVGGAAVAPIDTAGIDTDLNGDNLVLTYI